MARITISGSTAKVTDTVLGGSPVATLKAWFDFAKGHNSVISKTGNGISSIEIDDDSTSIDPLLLALSNGFTVEGAPIFIKMSTSKYNGNMPVGISNCTYTDDEGTEFVRTWTEWHDDTHEHFDATDGDKIVPGNSWGEELSSAELTKLLSLTGYTLLLGQEVNAHREQPDGV